MRPGLSFQARRELLHQVAARYREASRKDRSAILDEFVATTGYARKYAIRLLSNPVPAPVGPIRRCRQRQYGRDLQEALGVAWEAANGICAKRLVPFLPTLVASLERHGHLVLDDETRTHLLAISASTADRILGVKRQADKPRGLSTTRSGALLKSQIRVRTFADWDDLRPGFMEIDLVAHCGSSIGGSHLYSLVLTDVATGWTECMAIRDRGRSAVIDAIERVRPLLPFLLLGIDTDNGTEFLNGDLIAYCEREHITFTRGRAYRKNDQCYVEQKNGSIVRQLVGYDRYEGELPFGQLTELYRAVRLYVNFFQPSMKLVEKHRDGSRTYRRYDAAETPFGRLCNQNSLALPAQERLLGLQDAVDPVRLLGQLGRLQDALWQHAVMASPAAAGRNQTIDSALRFDPAACGLLGKVDGEGAATAEPGGVQDTGQRRKYHRTAKAAVPRTWRTRADPFAEVWDEVRVQLEATPELTAKALLAALQQNYPGRYGDGQLRTLQRRVGEWRRQALLLFKDPWIDEERLADVVLPEPLSARMTLPAAFQEVVTAATIG